LVVCLAEGMALVCFNFDGASRPVSYVLLSV
jgi:hypothetical protein